MDVKSAALNYISVHLAHECTRLAIGGSFLHMALHLYQGASLRLLFKVSGNEKSQMQSLIKRFRNSIQSWRVLEPASDSVLSIPYTVQYYDISSDLIRYSSRSGIRKDRWREKACGLRFGTGNVYRPIR